MTGPGAIQKPTVFLSHAATDEPIARVIQEELRRIFANGVEVFVTSVPGVVTPGADWLSAIRTKLDGAHAVIVIITPVSINRPWIWFEVGASWSRMEQGEGRILPVCVPEIDKGELPEPLSRLHALSLGRAAETKLLFQTLCDHFGFGSMTGFKHSTIKAKLPKYPDLRVAESDLGSGTIYTGPYGGYTDAELIEVLDDRFVLLEWRRYSSAISPDWRRYLFNQELVHFREVDEEFDLPPGTARRLLVPVVTQRYEARTTQVTENTVRFEHWVPPAYEGYTLGELKEDAEERGLDVNAIVSDKKGSAAKAALTKALEADDQV